MAPKYNREAQGVRNNSMGRVEEYILCVLHAVTAVLCSEIQ